MIEPIGGGRDGGEGPATLAMHPEPQTEMRVAVGASRKGIELIFRRWPDGHATPPLPGEIRLVLASGEAVTISAECDGRPVPLPAAISSPASAGTA